MESIYKTSVKNVPSDYNEPTKGYKKHVWIAVAGILSFFIFYLYLTYWFFFSAYRLLMDAFGGGDASLWSVGIGIASLFLGIFMLKAFFFVQTKYESQDRQIKPAEEPLLFDYLHQLADEIGAPRPHKVYLSNRVNASVFYDLSFINLFFPSKKNLEIGLGLINVLNLGEFKAVLAHEFGHFAQKSMLVGRWVYIANQIANSIISKRDALDSFLAGLSSIDIRIAWIGWILSLIVWSIRSLVELIFRVVVLSQRALSREMEFQADLVAVSVTGSDALIHALHKLQAADAAFTNALAVVNEQLGEKKAIEDIYSIQTNAIEKTALILNDDKYGKSPNLPESHPEEHRVFSDKIAQPPKMWATHPPDQEREANAKKRYIPGEIDPRSAWSLFKNASETRLMLTADLIKTAQVETAIQPTSEVLIAHNKQFEKSYFNPKYKGVYLNRFFCQAYADVESLYLNDITSQQAETKIKELYPDSLVIDLEDFTTLKEEINQLEAIKDKRLSESGSEGIWHRGTQIRRKELPEVIEKVNDELALANSKISAHDQLCRTTHLRLAEKIGNGWDDYLKGLLSIIHYSEHHILNINDAHHLLARVFAIVTADNKVSSSELLELTKACNEVYYTLEKVYKDRNDIVLDAKLLSELESESWEKLLEPFTLGPANEHNINEWIQVIGGWVESYVNSLSKLRSEALEVLIWSEEKVQDIYQSSNSTPAIESSKIKVSYPTMLPGQERPMTLKLNLWDRFISADGIVPAVAKFAVAASIVGATVYAAGTTNQSDISIYNGLATAVMVNLDGDKIYVDPHSYKTVAISASNNFDISANTAKGELIETFQPDFYTASSHYIYNVAGAAALYEYTVYYGGTPGDGFESLGNKKWFRSKVDFIFRDPPETITTSHGGSTTRDALIAVSDVNPNSILGFLQKEADQQSLIKAHVLWDPTEAENTIMWVGASALLKDYTTTLATRLERFPNEILSIRTLMDNGDEGQRNTICDKYSTAFNQDPTDPDLYYINTRCLPDGIEQSQKFIDGAKKWPKHGWLNYAASHSYSQMFEWEKAHQLLTSTYGEVPGLKNAIGDKVERIARFLETQGKKADRINDPKNVYLDYYLSMDAGKNKEPEVYIYYLINNGSLQEAMDLKNKNGIADPNIIALIASSDGAKEEWIEAALLLNPDSLNEAGIFALAGLHLKKGKDIAKFEKAFEVLSHNKEFNLKLFIDHLRADNYSVAEENFKMAGSSYFGQLAVMAYVAKGNRIPSHWKSLAQSLLFASEKPFIK